MTKHGLVAVNRDKHTAKGGIERERLERLVEAGMTIAEIADDVARSKGTVRHWLRAYRLRTQNSRGKRSNHELREARAAGQLTVTMYCAKHGDTDFHLEGRGYYRCKRCRGEAVTRRRRKVKAILISEAGGRCIICGYNGSARALAFHHVDPLDKRLEINAKGVAVALDTLRSEARKCAFCARIVTPRSKTAWLRFPYSVRDIREQYTKLLGDGTPRSGVTQSAECSAVNRDVVGSSPTPGARR
jgi:hypothetical protein